MANQIPKTVKADVISLTPENVVTTNNSQIRSDLVDVIKRLAGEGGCPATSGNFSVLLSPQPLRMLISPSGVDKSLITADDLLEVSERVEVICGTGKPSAETLLHAAIYQTREAKSILHVHTIWNTIISEKFLGIRLHTCINTHEIHRNDFIPYSKNQTSIS